MVEAGVVEDGEGVRKVDEFDEVADNDCCCGTCQLFMSETWRGGKS